MGLLRFLAQGGKAVGSAVWKFLASAKGGTFLSGWVLSDWLGGGGENADNAKNGALVALGALVVGIVAWCSWPYVKTWGKKLMKR